MKVKVKKIKFNDYVPRGVFEQIRWEKDVALKQLEDLGIPFGAKPELYAKPIVHAHWENEHLNRYGHLYHYCSNCGFSASHKDKNWCANCGAQMDEVIE